MYPSKEELKSKWWHRLFQAIIILLTISSALFFGLLSFGQISSQGIDFIAILLIIAPVVIFLVLKFLYYLLILYPIYGKKPVDFSFSKIFFSFVQFFKRNVLLIIAVIIFLISAIFCIAPLIQYYQVLKEEVLYKTLIVSILILTSFVISYLSVRLIFKKEYKTVIIVFLLLSSISILFVSSASFKEIALQKKTLDSIKTMISGGILEDQQVNTGRFGKHAPLIKFINDYSRETLALSSEMHSRETVLFEKLNIDKAKLNNKNYLLTLQKRIRELIQLMHDFEKKVIALNKKYSIAAEELKRTAPQSYLMTKFEQLFEKLNKESEDQITRYTEQKIKSYSHFARFTDFLIKNSSEIIIENGGVIFPSQEQANLYNENMLELNRLASEEVSIKKDLINAHLKILKEIDSIYEN